MTSRAFKAADITRKSYEEPSGRGGRAPTPLPSPHLLLRGNHPPLLLRQFSQLLLFQLSITTRRASPKFSLSGVRAGVRGAGGLRGDSGGCFGVLRGFVRREAGGGEERTVFGGWLGIMLKIGVSVELWRRKSEERPRLRFEVPLGTELAFLLWRSSHRLYSYAR